MDTLFKRLLSHLKIRHTQYANKLYNEHPYRYTMYWGNFVLKKKM